MCASLLPFSLGLTIFRGLCTRTWPRKHDGRGAERGLMTPLRASPSLASCRPPRAIKPLLQPHAAVPSCQRRLSSREEAGAPIPVSHARAHSVDPDLRRSYLNLGWLLKHSLPRSRGLCAICPTCPAHLSGVVAHVCMCLETQEKRCRFGRAPAHLLLGARPSVLGSRSDDRPCPRLIARGAR